MVFHKRYECFGTFQEILLSGFAIYGECIRVKCWYCGSDGVVYCGSYGIMSHYHKSIDLLCAPQHAHMVTHCLVNKLN